jgi:esterase/lipase superfamily enzyme
MATLKSSVPLRDWIFIIKRIVAFWSDSISLSPDSKRQISALIRKLRVQYGQDPRFEKLMKSLKADPSAKNQKALADYLIKRPVSPSLQIAALKLKPRVEIMSVEAGSKQVNISIKLPQAKITKPLVRTEIVSKLWSFLKKPKGLQDKSFLETTSFLTQKGLDGSFNVEASPSLKALIVTVKEVQEAMVKAGAISEKSVLFPVWYATDRERKQAKDFKRYYTGRRDSNGKVHYGKCYVEIPEYHITGSIGSNWLWREFTGEDDRLKIRRLEEYTEEELFWANVSESMAQVASESEGKRVALVYIHGYNNSFCDAAIRAAQLGKDIGFKGLTAFFSWASCNKDSPTGYTTDEDTISDSEPAILTFLKGFAKLAKADEIHVIAHSMGNRAFDSFLKQVAVQVEVTEGVRFKNIVLAAPDFGTKQFKKIATEYAKIAERTTLYVSDKDKAIWLSKQVHGKYDRVGLLPPVTVVGGIETVEVSNIDLSFLGHGYFAKAKDVIEDIHGLIVNALAPAKRFGLEPLLTPAGEPYWRIKK